MRTKQLIQWLAIAGFASVSLALATTDGKNSQVKQKLAERLNAPRTKLVQEVAKVEPISQEPVEVEHDEEPRGRA